jgi:SAM-dependent methyltransferase
MTDLGKAWYANPEFWARFAPVMFDERRWAEVPAVVSEVEGLAKPPKGGAVLDLCCGPGRHALEFARRGYAVTAVDLQAAYLSAAAESARDEGLVLELVRSDAREFARPGAFDLALNLYTSFGYFESPEEDARMLRAAREALKPGGVLVMEFAGKECVARDFVEGEWYELGGATVLTEYAVLDGFKRLRNRWIVIDAEGRHEAVFDRRLYSGAELEAALRAAGFNDVALYGSTTGIPYDHKALSLVAVALR